MTDRFFSIINFYDCLQKLLTSATAAGARTAAAASTAAALTARTTFFLICHFSSLL